MPVPLNGCKPYLQLVTATIITGVKTVTVISEAMIVAVEYPKGDSYSHYRSEARTVIDYGRSSTENGRTD